PACRTDLIDACVLAEPSRRDLVPEIRLPTLPRRRADADDRTGHRRCRFPVRGRHSGWVLPGRWRPMLVDRGGGCRKTMDSSSACGRVGGGGARWRGTFAARTSRTARVTWCARVPPRDSACPPTTTGEVVIAFNIEQGTVD